jgi:hypothetical protein
MRIEPQVLITWEVRAGYLYAVMETKKMNITLHDPSGTAHRIQIEGDKSLSERETMTKETRGDQNRGSRSQSRDRMTRRSGLRKEGIIR